MFVITVRTKLREKKNCLRYFASKRTIEACVVFARQDTSLSSSSGCFMFFSDVFFSP